MRVGEFLSANDRARYDAVYDQGLRALPEPAAVHDLPTAFGRVRAYRFGADGEPLVLLPGRFGTSVMYRANIPALAAHHRVHTVDLLGEPGRSEQTAPIRNAGDQARWLDETLAGLGLDQAHLLGVSIGGWLAANQATRRPERVASATLVEPVNTFAPMPPHVLLRAGLASLPYVSSWARPRFLTWIDGRSGADPADHVEGRLISAGMEHFRPALPSPARFTDDQLRGIRAPVLAIVAGRSVVHDPRRAVARARALVPRVEAELWPAATHAIAGQYADEIDERVLAFLAGLGS